MSFKLTTVKNTRDIKAVKRLTSLATTVDALYASPITGGNLAIAGASAVAGMVIYKANETTSASTSPFSGTIVATGDEFIVDTVNNSSTAHTGQRMAIDATGLLLTNSGTDAPTAAFVQVDVIGVATDKKIIARKV